MLARLVVIALLVPLPALAQACVSDGLPLWSEQQRNSADRDWADEARRIKDQENSSRAAATRLRLAVDAATVELKDCPYGDGGYQYLYDRLDDSGRFYVVRTEATGRFLAHAGDAQHRPALQGLRRAGLGVGQDAVPVGRLLDPARARHPHHPSTRDGGGLAVEAEIPLPCAQESCSARWDFQSWISVSCTPREDTGKKGTEFVVMRGNDGSWKKFGR